MALTILEAAKLNKGNVVAQSVIAMFAKASQILLNLPFRDIAGNAYSYNREAALPGIAFRGVNEAYTESTGIINPLTEALRIGGGDLDVDTFILKTQGEGVRATHESMKVKSLAAEMTRVIIKGDSTTQPREFDGLQKRIVGSQLVANGASAGGDVLSLSNLDLLIDSVVDPTHLIMSKAMRRRLTQAARTTTIGGFITQDRDAFGRTFLKYNDIPIIVAYPDNGGTEPIAFDEANPGGGGAVGTSLYCVSFQEGMVCGLQNGAMDVRDLGEIQTAPVKRTRVEWFSGLVIEHGRAAGRLYGIKDGVVVA